MNKKQTPSADEVLEKYEELEARGELDDHLNEAIVLSKFKARLARIPSVFDRPLTLGDAIALIETLVEWYESKGGSKKNQRRR